MPAYEDLNNLSPEEIAKRLEKDKQEALAKKKRLAKPKGKVIKKTSRTSPDGCVTFPRSKEEIEELEELAQMFDSSFNLDDELDDDWVFDPETPDRSNMPENYEDFVA